VHHPINAGDPIYLTIGWGALNNTLATTFLKHQYGSITVHQGSAGGTVVASVSWPVGDTTYWTAPAKVTFPPGTPGPLPKSQTKLFWLINGLATGTYYVDFTISLDQTVNDGLNNYGPGPVPGFAGTDCEMDVS